jgi:hypothetical protein
MNAVEIEEAVSQLAEQPFDADAFPFAFLEAFGNKETTLKRLRSGATNQSDIDGAVLQRNNIHLKVSPEGEVSATLAALRESPATQRQKAKFILATDGNTLEAENLEDGDAPLVCSYQELSDHFGYFLTLAGITTVKQIRENAFDIKATGRLNRLYVELLKENQDWDSEARREDLNHFMARLIFCFFAEDTGIFGAEARFTTAVEQMSARDSSNTHEVIAELFRAMNLKHSGREAAGIKSWAKCFPYVNGNLFSGNLEVPRFSKIARSYFLHVGKLDWTQINPDIFGSMIQAVADDEERGALGMHYTSVPNILKVLNPLFLDDLRAKLEEAGVSARKLQALRRRIARIRVFDPACGSGNFLVIAYKEMRAIEAEINRRLKEPDRRSDIPKTNFRGIEIRHFPCEIARLALIIAEYQCDVVYRSQSLALAEFLPLDSANWITCANALGLDWMAVCPPIGEQVAASKDDLFQPSAAIATVEFENEGGQTYICGNPPYLGSRWRDKAQQRDLAELFSPRTSNFKDLDYVAAWYLKASAYIRDIDGASCAFVATKSICQGEQVAMLWPLLFEDGLSISFAHRPFHWSNLASNKAGVTVVIVGVQRECQSDKELYEGEEKRVVPNIGPYLIPTGNVIVEKAARPLNGLPRMDYGNKPTDGGNLLLDEEERLGLLNEQPASLRFVKNYVGSIEFINGTRRYCLWVDNEDKDEASTIPQLKERFEKVAALRRASTGQQANANAATPHRFVFAPHRPGRALIVPRVSSERRPYLPAGLVDDRTVISDRAAVIYDPNTWLLSLIVSRMHLVWIATVCVRMRMDFSYSNTLGWNTFPVPILTEQNKRDLTRCAEEILLERERHFPATIADLYDPDQMPQRLRDAHSANDETLERIYVGRRFKNDTERLEKLFELYTAHVAQTPSPKKRSPRKKSMAL